MERLKFKKDNVKVVSISKVHPNTWNPKEEKTPEWERIRKGIELKGQRLPIVVRTHPTKKDAYEIIDGEQRYRACEDLGYEEVIIYDEGKMSDKEARELTIWYQQQVPFDEVELADLIKEILSMGEELELPYSEKEIEAYEKLLDFDFDQYEREPNENKGSARVLINHPRAEEFNGFKIYQSDEITPNTMEVRDKDDNLLLTIKLPA